MGAGVGGLGAFAKRMGRVAIPALRSYILPVAKQLGRNLLGTAIHEIGQVLAGKKRPSGNMLKHVAEIATKKTVKTSTPRFSGRSADRQYKSKATEHFSSIIAQINNHTNHFQIKSRQENSVRYSVWSSVCLIVKPRQQRKRASNLALPTAATTTFSGGAMEIASPVTHCAPDFFEKPNVLINYEGSDQQEVFPHVGCRGPQLIFFVTAKAKNLIDLNRIQLSVEVGVYTEHGRTRAKVNEHPIIFSNNTLHTLLSLWIVFER